MSVNWSQVDTILLDMDGTLLDLHYDNHFWTEYLPKVYAEEKDHDPDTVLDEVLIPLFQQHEGTLNWYCVEFWSEQLQLDILSLKNHTDHKIAYRELAVEFLQTCRQQSRDVRLATNAHRDVLNLKISKTGLDQYFDELIVSHELDAPKESQKFWQGLQQLGSFDPQRTLFIDDSESVLRSAQTYGIGHLLSIAKPDSKQDARSNDASEFPLIHSFQELIDRA